MRIAHYISGAAKTHLCLMNDWIDLTSIMICDCLGASDAFKFFEWFSYIEHVNQALQTWLYLIIKLTEEMILVLKFIIWISLNSGAKLWKLEISLIFMSTVTQFTLKIKAWTFISSSRWGNLTGKPRKPSCVKNIDNQKSLIEPLKTWPFNYKKKALINVWITF